MSEGNFWRVDHFPVVYEGNEPTAVLVDMASFSRIEIILDNLLDREAEAEDAILSASISLQQLLVQAQGDRPSADWERELSEL